MHQASVQISLKLDYKEIPVPQKIIIQLEPGEIRLIKRIKYAQHETDPVSAIKLAFKYAGGNQLQIAMQLTGRIVLIPGGVFMFSGTKLVLVCTPVLTDQKLMLQHATIKQVEMPMAPKFVKDFIVKVMNKSFIPNLGKSLHFDLEYILEEIRKKINDLAPVPLEIGKQHFLFRIAPNVEEGFHQLTIDPDAIHLNLRLAFSPKLTMEEAMTDS
ncbi:MAG: hypothetical protein ACRENG_18750 [bacterium]